MKMEVPVNSPAGGVVASIDVAIGEQVANGQQLATIG
jgi:biotin carboxyl carrier protein